MEKPTIQVTILPVTPFQQNCSLLICSTTKKAAVIDPGGEVERIQALITSKNVHLEKILLTHGHLDHCGGAAELAEIFNVPIEGPHPEEKFWLDQLPLQSQMFNFPLTPAFTPDRWLIEGDVVQFGQITLDIYHCPGHTPGHIVFFSSAEKLAFVGDVLFAGSIGRTDFPRGDHATLLHSIRNKLWPLCDQVGGDITFVPGHGPNSTFHREQATNPFLK